MLFFLISNHDDNPLSGMQNAEFTTSSIIGTSVVGYEMTRRASFTQGKKFATNMIQIIQFFGFILVKNLRIPGIKQKSYSVSFVSHKLPLKNCIQVTIQYNKATCLKITCFLHDLLVRHKTILRLDKIINNLQTLELWCVQERHYCVIV